jgi:hypothetical protein
MPRGREPEDHTGKVYGGWLALRRGPVVEPSINGQAIPWLCACIDCDHEQWIIPGQFKYDRGRLKCVGCVTIERDARDRDAANERAARRATHELKMKSRADEVSIDPAAFAAMGDQARLHGAVFDLDTGAALRAYEEQKGRCSATGTPLRLNDLPKMPRTAMLDRRDDTLPYREGNIRWIHRDIHRLFSVFGKSHGLDVALALATHTPLPHAIGWPASNDNDEVRQQLKNANAEAKEVALRRGAQVHPRVAAIKSA